jgi:hypothetical protein
MRPEGIKDNEKYLLINLLSYNPPRTRIPNASTDCPPEVAILRQNIIWLSFWYAIEVIPE